MSLKHFHFSEGHTGGGEDFLSPFMRLNGSQPTSYTQSYPERLQRFSCLVKPPIHMVEKKGNSGLYNLPEYVLDFDSDDLYVGFEDFEYGTGISGIYNSGDNSAAYGNYGKVSISTPMGINLIHLIKNKNLPNSAIYPYASIFCNPCKSASYGIISEEESGASSLWNGASSSGEKIIISSPQNFLLPTGNTTFGHVLREDGTINSLGGYPDDLSLTLSVFGLSNDSAISLVRPIETTEMPVMYSYSGSELSFGFGQPTGENGPSGLPMRLHGWSVSAESNNFGSLSFSSSYSQPYVYHSDNDYYLDFTFDNMALLHNAKNGGAVETINFDRYIPNLIVGLFGLPNLLVAIPELNPDGWDYISNWPSGVVVSCP